MMLGYEEIARFCRSLALLIHSGVGLGEGLFLLAQDASGSVKHVLENVGAQTEAGSTLAAAMGNSGAFPDYVTGLVQVGEETGCTEEALHALADYCETRCNTVRQIKHALTYPVMVMLLMMIVIAVLLIKVLPVFDRVYASMGSRLTGAAAGMLYLGQGLERMLPAILVSIAAAVAAVLLLRIIPAFQEKALHFWNIHFGDRGIARKFNNAQFAQALSMGIRSGLSMEEAAALAGKLLRDIPPAAHRCVACAEELASGVCVADALEHASLLPASECRLLSIGQRTGNADQIMGDIAQRMMEQAQESLESTVGRIEPTLVLTASILVGVILLAVMLPLVDIMAALG